MKTPFSSTITDEALMNASKSSSRQEPTNIKRRTLIEGALGGALAALLSSPGRLSAQGNREPNNPFVLLLKGSTSPWLMCPTLT
jgi:hypothetical protein